MIKVKWAVRFSTLRFSKEYLQTFELSRQLRSCISLRDLTDFVRSNDAGIRECGKTIVLEYFNEFPLNFNFRSMSSPLQVFEYALGLEGLTLYEEQLRYANICKMIEYAPRDAREMEKRAHEQERRIIARTKHESFDLVDALNWILYQRAHISSELVEYSLDIICAAPIERSESIMAKMLNSFLKKIEEVQWRSLRKHRPIFEFICFKYELSIESPKLMVSNFEKLTSLKLHLLGYDRVPKAVDQIAARLEGAVQKLDMYHLQLAFKCFDHLPPNYNRRLFGQLFREVLTRLGREMFQLTHLPLRRLTRKELEAFMHAFVGNGLYIRNSIYFINCEDSQLLLASEVFLKALTAELLRPLRAQENLIVDYSSYMCVGRALLDHYLPDDPIRPKIVHQLKAVQEAVFGKGKGLESASRNFSVSLCGWFTIYSLDLELALFENRKQVLGMIEQEIAAFLSKKFSSTWKSKKHHQQLREIINKHANSPFPEVRALLLGILQADLAPSTSFDSNHFPPYIFMLEDCEQAPYYQPVLAPLYPLLRGEDALAFVETYIRAPRKSARLTLAIMDKLWKINYSPAVMLKLAAGVPLIYFESGLGGLLSGAVAILEDTAIFLKAEDLDQLSDGELTNLIRFCSKFVKNTRIISHKLLVLALGRAAATARSKETEVQMQLLMELLTLALELNYSDKEVCISHVNEMLHKIEETTISSPLVLVRLLEAKLMLKASAATDLAGIAAAVQKLVERAGSEQQMEERAKVIVVLLKLHALEEVELHPDRLRQFCEVVKGSLLKEKIYPSELPPLLGSNFIEQCDLVSFSRLQELKDIFLCSLGVEMQEEPQFYIYLVRLAHKVRAPEVIERALDHLSLLPLEPSFVVVLVNTLKYHTAIFRPQLVERLLKDTAAHFSTFRHHYIDVLYYLNTVCYDHPPLVQTCNRLLQEVEKELEAEVKAMLLQKNPEPEQLYRLLVKTYKYYWVVIKNKQVSDTTLAIFKLNIRHIKKVFEVVNFSSFDGISPEIILMMHIFLFPKTAKLEATEQQQVKNKTKFFTSRSEPDKYEKYHEEMRKLEKTIKTQPVRSFQLEEQLCQLKIYCRTQPKEKPECYYNFGERKEGSQLHYCITHANTRHYIFIVTPKLHNNAGSYKGRVRLLEQLYTDILGSKPVFYDEKDPITISFS